MADLDGAEAEEPALQDRLVLKGTVFDTHYEVGQLPVGRQFLLFSHFGWRSRREVCRLRTISSMVEASDQSPAARQSFGEAYCMHSRSLRRRKQGSLREWENSQSLGLGRPFVTRARSSFGFCSGRTTRLCLPGWRSFRAPPSFSACSCRSFVREVCLPKRCRVHCAEATRSQEKEIG